MLALVAFLVLMIPIYTFLKTGSEATITIESDREIPFEFTLSQRGGTEDGPFLQDCKIKIQNGVGSFLTGSYKSMDYFGFPSTALTRVKRGLIVDVVNRGNEIVKHQYSDTRHRLILEVRESPNSPYGKRFLVTEQPNSNGENPNSR